MSSSHPAPEDLLLWHSGELDPRTATEIEAHVRDCRACEKKINQFDSLFTEVSEVKAARARWSFRAAAREQEQVRRRKRRMAFRWGTSGIAASLIAVLIVTNVLDLTPSARADELLTKAVNRETRDTHRRQLFRLSSNGTAQCGIAVGLATPSSFCSDAAARFQAAGWQWSDLLSARGFQRWRGSLKQKRDAVRKLAAVTEITTTTDESPLRRATVQLRNADYQPVAEFFEFATSYPGEINFAVVESPGIPAQLPQTAETPLPSAPIPREQKSSKPNVATPVDPTDTAEAQARLALHRLGLDRDVLIAIEREDNTLKVWGAVPDSRSRDQLAQALRGISDVLLSVASGVEQGDANASLPWKAFQGQDAPLAYDQIDALFPNNPDGRQGLVNALDTATRRVAGASRSRDGILALASKLRSSDDAAPLNRAAAELQAGISEDMKSIAKALQFLLGPVTVSSARMTYPRATELYTLVHQVVFLSRPGDDLTLDQALTRIRQLLE